MDNRYDEGHYHKEKVQIELRKAKDIKQFVLPNHFLHEIPKELFANANLKLLNLGFNNIEYIPLDIKNIVGLEEFILNDNPIQNVPIEISSCTKLKVVNFSNTYIKWLPREMGKLRNMSYLNLDGCDLKGNLGVAYPKGIVDILKYFKRKMQRAEFREKIVKALKEQVYHNASIDQIQDSFQIVMDNLKDVDVYTLKRLLRNLKYIFPQNIYDIDTDGIRNTLLYSRYAGAGNKQANETAPDGMEQETLHEFYKENEPIAEVEHEKTLEDEAD